MLCVLAKLDTRATDALRAVQSTASAFGLSPAPLHGHITLATYLGSEEEAFINNCSGWLTAYRAFSVPYKELRVLVETSIIAALPRLTPELRAIHDRIAAEYGSELDSWTSGEDWLPHTTLLFSPQTALEPVCREMRDRFTPFAAKVDCIEFSRVGSGHYEFISKILLR